MAFPTTPVLDNFNRADEGPPPGPNWLTAGYNTALSTVQLVSNAAGTSGSCLWGTPAGPDTEVYFTWSVLPANLTGGSAQFRVKDYGGVTVDGYRTTFLRIDANPGVRVQFFRVDNNVATQLGSTANEAGGALVDGVALGTDMVGSTISAYINRSGSWSSAITSTSGDTTYTVADTFGMTLNTSVQDVDEFGGGTQPAQNQLMWVTA